MSFQFEKWISKHGLTVAPDDAFPVWGWVDLETTGLDPDADVILEFGFVMTDEWGNIIPDSAYHSLVSENTDHYRERTEAMIDVVAEMHSTSALLGDLAHNASRPAAQVQKDMFKVLGDFGIASRELYWAGSSVHFDVSMLRRYMFNLEEFLHYRQINVSTLKTLCQELNPTLYSKIIESLNPFNLHRSMSDLGDSINEYRAYVDNFLFI